MVQFINTSTGLSGPRKDNIWKSLAPGSDDG